MKTRIASVLFALAFIAPAWAAMPHATSTDASAVAAIKQLGQDLGDAMIALDIEKLDRMYGDDWVTVGSSGTVYTKEMLLRDFKADKKKLTWFELRPMDVQVFGDVAVVEGNVAEKRIVDGKETYMEVVYSDILKKRDGRWVVVRSMGAGVK
ncbi:MAG: nuclear transport factor 2 family protein [Dokdonella sp.]